MESSDSVVYDNFVDCDYESVSHYNDAVPKTKDPLSTTDDHFLNVDYVKREKCDGLKIKQENILCSEDGISTDSCAELIKGDPVKMEHDEESKDVKPFIPFQLQIKEEDIKKIKDVKPFIPFHLQIKEEDIKKEDLFGENIVKRETVIDKLNPFVKITRLPALDAVVKSECESKWKVKVLASSYSPQSLHSNTTALENLSCSKNANIKDAVQYEPVFLEIETLTDTSSEKSSFDEEQLVDTVFECDSNEIISFNSSNITSSKDNLVSSQKVINNDHVIKCANSLKPVIHLRKCDELNSLIKHVELPSVGKTYLSSICTASFKVKAHLDMHLRRHSKIKPFVCKKLTCAKSFVTKAELISHTRVHSAVSKPVTCDVCGKGIKLKENLEKHMKRHLGTKPHCCKVCTKTFFTKKELKFHEISHSNNKPFNCKKCLKSFKRKVSLVLHEQFNSCYHYKHIVNVTKET